MSILAITCPNCGASEINVDTAREHSFCSYCGTTIRTKDVLHLDTESTTFDKLKRNALSSFELGQYGNALADWRQAIKINRTDHESYFGIVRCCLARNPNIGVTTAHKKYNYFDTPVLAKEAKRCYENALAYAPPEEKEKYRSQIEVHNGKNSVKQKLAADRLFSIGFGCLLTVILSPLSILLWIGAIVLACMSKKSLRFEAK